MQALTLPPEFLERLRWFEKLRWLAAGGLAAASLLGDLLELPHLWPSLLIVAVIVGAYNFCFHFFLRKQRESYSDTRLKVLGITEILLDLTMLLVTVHFTGGLASPALIFFVFHMAIGTTMLSTRTMYEIAAGACAGAAALHLAESYGLLARQTLDPAAPACGRLCDFNLAALIVALFGIVYLMGTVTERSKLKSVELRETTLQLRRKTVRLEHVLNEIRDLEHRKSHYMRISAHQLRSPLATVKTLLEVLTQGFVDPRSQRGGRLLSGAVERADHLLAIVNDLLELAKIREGQERAPWTRGVDINDILAAALDSLEPFARSRGVRLISNLEGRPILRWGVPPDLRFAFDNLIDNAIRYSRPEGEVKVSVVPAGERTTITVADQGIGIPEDLQPGVFLEFVRGPEAKHLEPNGTGLGLTIVKAAIELHGGSVALSSQQGAGTKITVSLPLRNSLPAEARAAAAVAP
ncbi:MAG: HAMP domain-containing histidine kinase [bacterium]|nr:HAMP domain-containing histidine kinase [bacterium]